MNSATNWTDQMILEAVRDSESLTRQARERAYELADADFLDISGCWKLTQKAHDYLAPLKPWFLNLKAPRAF